MARRKAERVLVIEFDPDYRAVISTCVELADAQADPVPTLAQAVRRLEQQSHSAVVWGVPAGEKRRAEGVTQLHKAGGVPLIILDESYEEARAAFEAGADQVLPKPFVPGALVGAVVAALRSTGPRSVVSLATRIEVGSVAFDSGQRSVRSGSTAVQLTKREWELVSFLLANPNQYFAAEEIANRAWGDGSKFPEQVRTYVGRLRRKLAGLEWAGELQSQQGKGYCLRLEAPA